MFGYLDVFEFLFAERYAGLKLSLSKFLGLFRYRQTCYAGRLEAGLLDTGWV